MRYVQVVEMNNPLQRDSAGRKMPKLVLTLACLFTALCAGQASAVWELVDNFESLAVGNLGGQGGWNAANATFQVGTDPSDAANQAAKMNGNAGVAYITLGTMIANGHAGTLFWRMRNTNPANVTFGMSDVAAPAAFGDYETQMRTFGDPAAPPGGSGGSPNIDVRDVGVFTTVGTYTPDQWTNFWMVINNQNDTFDLYSSVGSDPAVQLGAGGHGFRNGTGSNALVTAFIGQAATQLGHDGFVDDIHVDAEGQNLAIPSAGNTILPGDVNASGTVNLVDYQIIRDHFQLINQTRSTGDLNGDRLVNFADFRRWTDNRTTGAGAGAGDFLSEHGALPEPTSFFLALMAAGARAGVARRRLR